MLDVVERIEFIWIIYRMERPEGDRADTHGDRESGDDVESIHLRASLPL